MVKKAAQATPNQLLRLARLERGWTQKDVADRIGAPLNLNVNRWERGTASPSSFYVQRLCEVFGKSARELGLLPPSTPPAQPAQSSPQETESNHTPSVTQHLWNVPFRRNPFFTGRAHLLVTLHNQFNQLQDAALIQSQALTGLGGIGKTQTAVEYAYRYHDRYRAIFWARAASRERMLGTEHPKVAENLNDLAQLYFHQGRYEQAEPLYQRALAIYEQTLGSEHLDTAGVREDYANFLRKMQQTIASGVDADFHIESVSPDSKK